MSKVGFHIRILAGLGVAILLCLIMLIQLWTGGKEKWDTYQLQQGPLERIVRADILLQEQRRKLENLSASIQKGGERQAPITSHFQFVEYLSRKSEQYGVKMLSLPIEKKETLSGYEMIEEHFSIEGKLPSLMQFLYQLEVEDKVGRMIYLNLERKEIRIRTRKRTVLMADIKINRIQKL